ncbi:hypothetical protein GQ42DRAFT_158140 [Ramicandelaber brevisporus]|nr:hypothetical protein GQ42DRAFT_158140 [Ramicandelaber brevisporus]
MAEISVPVFQTDSATATTSLVPPLPSINAQTSHPQRRQPLLGQSLIEAILDPAYSLEPISLSQSTSSSQSHNQQQQQQQRQQQQQHPPPTPSSLWQLDASLVQESLAPHLTSTPSVATSTVAEAETETQPKVKRARAPPSKQRSRLDPDQQRALEDAFKVDPRPKTQRVAELAEEIGLDKKVVQVWLQNRRQRQKTDADRSVRPVVEHGAMITPTSIGTQTFIEPMRVVTDQQQEQQEQQKQPLSFVSSTRVETLRQLTTALPSAVQLTVPDILSSLAAPTGDTELEQTQQTIRCRTLSTRKRKPPLPAPLPSAAPALSLDLISQNPSQPVPSLSLNQDGSTFFSLDSASLQPQTSMSTADIINLGGSIPHDISTSAVLTETINRQRQRQQQLEEVTRVLTTEELSAALSNFPDFLEISQPLCQSTSVAEAPRNLDNLSEVIDIETLLQQLPRTTSQ